MFPLPTGACVRLLDRAPGYPMHSKILSGFSLALSKGNNADDYSPILYHIRPPALDRARIVLVHSLHTGIGTNHSCNLATHINPEERFASRVKWYKIEGLFGSTGPETRGSVGSRHASFLLRMASNS